MVNISYQQWHTTVSLQTYDSSSGFRIVIQIKYEILTVQALSNSSVTHHSSQLCSENKLTQAGNLHCQLAGGSRKKSYGQKRKVRMCLNRLQDYQYILQNLSQNQLLISVVL